ncbi:MAG: hypothetical protein LBN95_11980 [Prevotellaceae bacterium]|jgi:hypothetical protein|nr:hypothetical protein [Prevotellaceae bacterium]
MKKKIYNLADGGRITAATAQEFVEQLRIGSLFDSDCTNEQYMQNFADRYKIQTGNIVRTDNAEIFLDDLQKFGYIEQ